MAVFKVKNNYWFFEGFVAGDLSEIEIATKIKKIIYSGKSPFQEINVYDTYTYGKVLVLDEVIQAAEKDEFIYHEALCQPCLFLHQNPKKVLIIGGGDGGALRQALMHKIEEACLVEIDSKVIEVCKKYLPSIHGKSFEDKRSKIIIEDGKQYIKKKKDYFDIIILDLSDPAGPAEDLVSLSFYRQVKRALKKNGIISVQAGSFTYQPKLVENIFKRLKKTFSYLETRKAVVPSFQDGQYSFILASDKKLSRISINEIEKKYKKMKLNLNYYYPAMHFASKVLPYYLKTKYN